MRAEASLELLASREDVWAFLSEPYHLADWWPGISGVQPDRRGFAPGARWQVQGTRSTNPLVGRRAVSQLLVIRDVEPYERWSWTLLDDRLEVDLRLRSLGPVRTRAALAVRGAWLLGLRRSLPREALGRLHALCQTSAPYGAEV